MSLINDPVVPSEPVDITLLPLSQRPVDAGMFKDGDVIPSKTFGQFSEAKSVPPPGTPIVGSTPSDPAFARPSVAGVTGVRGLPYSPAAGMTPDLIHRPVDAGTPTNPVAGHGVTGPIVADPTDPVQAHLETNQQVAPGATQPGSGTVRG